jgi:hypothetical protein
MPRGARIVIPNVPHHVTQRGDNRQDVFFADEDRGRYLETLGERCDAGGCCRGSAESLRWKHGWGRMRGTSAARSPAAKRRPGAVEKARNRWLSLLSH